MRVLLYASLFLVSYSFSFTSLSEETLKSQTSYSIGSKCSNEYVCRESNVFRLPPSSTPRSSNYTCNIDGVYITLGDKFVNKESDNIYRLGFRVSDLNCLDQLRINIFSVNPITQDMELFIQEESLYEDEQRRAGETPEFFVRHYQFKGSVNGVFYDIDRYYVFYNIHERDLPDNGYFAYSLDIHNQPVKGPFIFDSKVNYYYNGKTDQLEILSFGDHDSETQGTITYNALLASDNVDLYLLLGDYAYNIFNDNGERGELYFTQMEPIFTRQPVILIVGNHEWFDEFSFFFARMSFPGDPYLGEKFKYHPLKTEYTFGSQLIRDNLENDLIHRNSHQLFYFVIRDIFILSANLDVIMAQETLFPSVISTLDELFVEHKDAVHKIYSSHRPLYCAEIELFAKECILNTYILQPLVALLNMHSFNILLFAHMHHYERMIPLQNFRPKYKSLPETSHSNKSFNELGSLSALKFTQTVPSTAIVSGSAGCDHLFIEFKKIPIEFLLVQKQIIPGFSVFSFYKLGTYSEPKVLIRFISSAAVPTKSDSLVTIPGSFADREALDSVIVRGQVLESDTALYQIVLFILGFFSVLGVCLVSLIKQRSKKLKTQEEERDSRQSNEYSQMNMEKLSNIMEDDIDSMMSKREGQ